MTRESAVSWIPLGIIFLVGLAIGSFLNVVIWRVPRGQSVVAPPSACPGCGSQLLRRDNIPVVSWLLLRGRCRSCKKPISARYPIIEAVTALLFVLVAWWRGLEADLPALLLLAALSIALAAIDLELHRLPDPLVLTLAVGGGVLLVAATALTRHETGWWPLARGGLGLLILGGFYAAVKIAVPHGMGLGDVKLALPLGLYLGWYGWGSLAVGWFAAFLVGGAVSIALLVTRKVGRKGGIPFGPWMLVGAWVGIVWGHAIADGYLALIR